MTFFNYLAGALTELAVSFPVAYIVVSLTLATLAGLAAQVAFGGYR